MNIHTQKITGVAAVMMMAINLAVPSLVHADRGHHHHKHHHGHHHRHHHHDHHHYNHVDAYLYSQPRGYYQQYYPQPQYNYSYYPPAQVYAMPPQMMMGINTGNMDFMLRF